MIKDRTTRIAFQAATAVAIAEVLAYLFQFERSYWAMLTALFLISQTWGESVKKSVERVVMTIVGGGVGTILYAMLPHQPWLIFSCLIIVVFFTVFFIEISYFVATFFITLFVVFLFALIGQWNLQILQDRIIETFIGASIACAVALTIFPVQATDETKKLFNLYFQDLSQFVSKALSLSLNQNQLRALINQKNELAQKHHALREQSQTSYYELVFSNFSKNKFDFVLEHFALLTHYVTSLYETRLELTVNPNYHQEIASLKQIVSHNLTAVARACFNQTATSSGKVLGDETFDEVKNQLLAKYEQDVTAGNKINSSVFANYSYLYFMEKINKNLLSLYNEFA